MNQFKIMISIVGTIVLTISCGNTSTQPEINDSDLFGKWLLKKNDCI